MAQLKAVVYKDGSLGSKWYRCRQKNTKTRNINTASLEELTKHPKILLQTYLN
jgi:hypothetical protein